MSDLEMAIEALRKHWHDAFVMTVGAGDWNQLQADMMIALASPRERDRLEQAEAEVKRLRDALRALYGVATTPTQHFNEQPAAQAIAASIRRTIPGFLPDDPS